MNLRDRVRLTIAKLSKHNRDRMAAASWKAIAPLYLDFMRASNETKAADKDVSKAWGELLSRPGWDLKNWTEAMKAFTEKQRVSHAKALEIFRVADEAALKWLNEQGTAKAGDAVQGQA
jgi:hypothetical protein